MLIAGSLLNPVTSSSRFADRVSHIGSPVKAIKNHFKQAKVNRIRREIQKELAAFEQAKK